MVARIPSSSFSYVISPSHVISPCRTETSSSITAFSLLPVMVKPSLFCAAAAVDEKTDRDLIVRETRRNAMMDYTTQRQ